MRYPTKHENSYTRLGNAERYTFTKSNLHLRNSLWCSIVVMTVKTTTCALVFMEVILCRIRPRSDLTEELGDIRSRFSASHTIADNRVLPGQRKGQR